MAQVNNKGGIPGIAIGLIIAAGGAAVEGVRRFWRSRQEKKRQKIVNDSYVSDTGLVADNKGMEITVMEKSDLPANMVPTKVSHEEAENWKPFILDSLGQVGRAGVNINAVDGLLVCNVPLSELTEVKGNPGQLRGYITKDGKFTEQAKFQEAGLKQAAPMLVMQAMAAVTSQYYQQVITERLDVIEQKVDIIASYLEEEDRAKLADAFRRLHNYSKMEHFIEGDIQSLESISSTAFIVREKFRGMLKKVDLKADWAWKDSSEAQNKMNKLNNSNYFMYLEMAKASEVLYFASQMLLVRAADDLHLDPSRKDGYFNEINLHLWEYYQEDFERKKHDVIEYLKLAENSAVFKREEIEGYIKVAQNQFDQAEQSFKRAETECDRNVKIILAIDRDGNIVEYKNIDEQ